MGTSRRSRGRLVTALLRHQSPRPPPAISGFSIIDEEVGEGKRGGICSLLWREFDGNGIEWDGFHRVRPVSLRRTGCPAKARRALRVRKKRETADRHERLPVRQNQQRRISSRSWQLRSESEFGSRSPAGAGQTNCEKIAKSAKNGNRIGTIQVVLRKRQRLPTMTSSEAAKKPRPSRGTY
jgi:hypothetical protein